MRHFTSSIVGWLASLLFMAGSAQAGVSVVGLEIGVTTVDQARQLLRSAGVKQRGISQLTNGPMLESNGDGLDIAGLKSVLALFDDQQRLAAVMLTVNKDRFGEIARLMAEKYSVVSQRRPFVGNAFVRMKSGDVRIEIDAPHMSFEMTVLYGLNSFWNAMEKAKADEQAAKERTERGKL